VENLGGKLKLEDEFLNEWAPISVTFSNTQKCTLRCKYCYADGGRLDDAVIQKEVADAAIDLILENAQRKSERPSINFLGEGEATADWDSFCYIIDRFRAECITKNLVPHVELSTNGLFPQKRVAYISENVDQITFSLDGLPSAHDAQRVLPNGKGSFELIVERIKDFDVIGKKYSLRSTATVEAVEHLSEFIEFIGSNLKTKNIHIEPVFNMAGIAVTAQDTAHPEPIGFVNAFRKARQVAASFGIEIYFSGSDLTIKEAYCGVSDARNMIVTSKGIVTSCNEVLQPSDLRSEVFQYGKWDADKKRFVIDGEKVRGLSKIKVKNLKKCQGCFAKHNCAGDCYAKTMALHGDIFTESYTERCIVTRELLRDNLLIGLLASGTA
jgi:uncharacterized protein